MKVVLIIGGAVSGSTAVKKLTDEGIRCVVVDQNRMPYGKIEDGLPRWHEKQRINEYFISRNKEEKIFITTFF